MSAPYIVEKLAKLGVYGVNLHDNDLIPIDASAHERDTLVRDFKAALENYGLKVPMATTNLFSDPTFKDGAFTSADARVRAFALQKTMGSMDLGFELGAKPTCSGADAKAAKWTPGEKPWMGCAISATR